MVHILFVTMILIICFNGHGCLPLPPPPHDGSSGPGFHYIIIMSQRVEGTLSHKNQEPKVDLKTANYNKFH